MNFALANLWYERARYLPAILAVAFSAVLMALQGGMLLGLFAMTSMPVDHSRADLWIGSPKVLNVDTGRAIPENFQLRLAEFPDVSAPEVYMQGFSYWSKPDGGGAELCMIIGSRLEPDSLGRMNVLTPDLCEKLSEPGAVVICERDMGTPDDPGRLGIYEIGQSATINERARVRVVGAVPKFKGLAGAYVFCSVETARVILRLNRDQTTYLLAKCPSPARAEEVAKALRAKYDDMSVFTSWYFSWRTQWHWVTKTNAGIAIGYAALLGLLVGAVVTSQTLYAATMASMREFGVLLALGIPRWRIAGTVMVQSAWVGVLGTLIAYPATEFFASLARLKTPVDLRWELLAITAGVTILMALISGLAALRAIRQIEPVNLLR